MKNKYKYQGMWPVAPTPFHENGDVDYEGMERILDCMVDQEIQGICILANFSEQFLLSDEEREKLTKLCIKKVDVAIRDLQFSEKRITKDIRKTISSAVANAENNFQYDIDKLIVKEAYCGKKINL